MRIMPILAFYKPMRYSMFLLDAIAAPLTAVVKAVGGHFQAKQELKKAATDSKISIEQARTKSIVKRLENAQEADIAWENLSIENSGWRADWFTVLLSIPIILCFIPGMDGYVTAGFKAISENVPEWYRWAFMAAVGSAFGLKKLTDLAKLKKGAK